MTRSASRWNQHETMAITDEDLFENEWADDGESEADLLVCPNCRAEVHEDTQKCPVCGDWITPVYPAEAGRKWIWTIAAGIVLLAFLLMAFL